MLSIDIINFLCTWHQQTHHTLAFAAIGEQFQKAQNQVSSTLE